MRIIVPLKQVPETSTVKMDPVTGTMVREGVEAIINPLDLFAIELAVRLKERHGAEVIGLTMGPPKAAAALREAIAMGLDAGVLLSSPGFAGADTWATSYVIAAAIRKLGIPELIICGERATDGDTGQVGPGIAAWLDLPVVSYVSAFCDLAPASCRVERMIEDGYETLEMEFPGVLTVVKEAADPRLPTLQGKKRARVAEIPVWGPQDLDVRPEHLGLQGSPTRVVQIFRPKVSRVCTKVFALDGKAIPEAVRQLCAFLDSRGGRV
jgi:electron transfer flavoprotein beta subunit